MYQNPKNNPNNCYSCPKPSAMVGTNTQPPDPYNPEAQNYCEREKSTRKSKNTNKPTNCPLHNKKDLNKLEECYWAKWKPSKTTTGIPKMPPNGFPRFPYIDTTPVNAHVACQNCQRLMQSPKCPQCYRNLVSQLSSAINYTGGFNAGARYKQAQPTANHACVRCAPFKYEETTDCEGMTTARDGETTEAGYTDAGPGKDDYHFHNRNNGTTGTSNFNREEKKTSEKGISACCPCELGGKTDGSEAKPNYVNKSCFTEGSDLMLQKYANYDEEVPVRGPSRGSKDMRRPNEELNEKWHSESFDDAGTTSSRGGEPVEPIPYHVVQFDMEDQCCGSSGEMTPTEHTMSASVSSNAQKSYPFSSNVNSVIHSVSCDCYSADDNQHHEENDHMQHQDHQHHNNLENTEEYRFPCGSQNLNPFEDGLSDHQNDEENSPRLQQIHPKPTSPTPTLVSHEKEHEHQNSEQVEPQLRDNTSCHCESIVKSCVNHTSELVKHMKRLTEYIPKETQTLLKEMTEIITLEPIQEIKKQAEKILECALEAEAERLRKIQQEKKKTKTAAKQDSTSVSNKSTLKTSNSPRILPVATNTSAFPKDTPNYILKCAMDENPLSYPRVPLTNISRSPPLSIHSESPELNESLLIHEQQRLKKQQEQLQVQEQLRKVQQQQLQQQLQEQRKLLEEQAKEIQRQRDLQKKQALLQQQEQQLRQQAQAQQARLQQLDAASVKLRIQQELCKEGPNALGPGLQVERVDITTKKPISEDRNQARKPLLSAAFGRVTGVLRHSYPLGKSSKKSVNKLSGKLK